MLGAHNCYQDTPGQPDRMTRALGTGAHPMAIEQDVAWDAGRGMPVVTHDPALASASPSLDEHFFDRMRGTLDAALRADDHAHWPLYQLHLDFKTNEPELRRAVWSLLGKYERWLTTAVRVADESSVQPLQRGPLIVLVEDGPDQARSFHDVVPVGARLRVFGTVPYLLPAPADDIPAEIEAAFRVTPETLIPTPATNYRRWSNFNWVAIEHGGQPVAGDWTPADAARLRSFVDRARRMGVWMRFYTLNGYAPGEGQGWDESYNFGSLEAARIRWRAAIEAGVDIIATDQYEELARVMEEYARDRRFGPISPSAAP